MLSTMQDFPLTIGMIFRHGRTVFGDSEVVTFEGDASRRASFAEVADRVDQLSAALRRLGVESGDRVATFSWNNQEHLEAYFAIPCMGGVLHTLNIRLFPDQLVYIVNHAEDKIVIVDASLVPAAREARARAVERRALRRGRRRRHRPARGGNRAEVLRYDELLAAEQPGITYPEIDERAAAAMCYTSGTTGNPKGVVYSHRSTFLHSLGVLRRVRSTSAIATASSRSCRCSTPTRGACRTPRGWPAPTSSCPIATSRPNRSRGSSSRSSPRRGRGAHDLDRAPPLQRGEPRRPLVGEARPLRGSAVPRSLMERFEEQFGIRIVQGWGMTETSPLAAVSCRRKASSSARPRRWTGAPSRGRHRRRRAAHRRRRRRRAAVGRRSGR